MFLDVILFFPMSKRKPRSFTPASHSAHFAEHGICIVRRFLHRSCNKTSPALNTFTFLPGNILRFFVFCSAMWTLKFHFTPWVIQ